MMKINWDLCGILFIQVIFCVYYFKDGLWIVLTLISASSVFSGLAFSAWDASMIGMGMKRMVKFLQEEKENPVTAMKEKTAN